MPPLLLSALSWPSCTSATSAAIVERLLAPSDTMPSHGISCSVQFLPSEEQPAAPCNNSLWRSSLRRHGTSVAQRLVMDVPRIKLVSSHRGASASIMRPDAKPRYIALATVAAIRRKQPAAPCNNSLWRSSLRRHATSVTQRVIMQVLLLRASRWLPGDPITSPLAVGVLAVTSDSTPSWRLPHLVTQTMLRANELQHTTSPCGGHR